MRSASGTAAAAGSAAPSSQRRMTPNGTSSAVTAKQKWSRHPPSMWM